MHRHRHHRHQRPGGQLAVIAQEPPQHRRAQRHHHVVDRDVEAVLDLLDVVEVQLGQRDVRPPVTDALNRVGGPTNGAAMQATSPRPASSRSSRPSSATHWPTATDGTRTSPPTPRDLKRAGLPGALDRFRRRHLGFDGAQLRKQVGARHPVDRRVMDLRHHRQHAALTRVGVGNALDHPHLPQRPAAIQRHGGDVSADLDQFLRPPGDGRPMRADDDRGRNRRRRPTPDSPD